MFFSSVVVVSVVFSCVCSTVPVGTEGSAGLVDHLLQTTVELHGTQPTILEYRPSQVSSLLDTAAGAGVSRTTYH